MPFKTQIEIQNCVFKNNPEGVLFQNVFEICKVFYELKLAREFKFHTSMTISASKSAKKVPKMMKRPTNWTYT